MNSDFSFRKRHLSDVRGLGQVAYVISAVGWVFVDVLWNDRAITIGISISATAVTINLVRARTN